VIIDIVEEVEFEECDGVVYNFSVEEDESYTLHGIVVHNCMCYIQAIMEQAKSLWARLSDWIKGKLRWPKLQSYMSEFDLPLRSIPPTPGGDSGQRQWWDLLLAMALIFEVWFNPKSGKEIPSLFGIEGSEWVGEFQ